MSYEAAEGEISAILRAEDGVPVLPMGTGPSVLFVAPGSLTGGRHGLFCWDMPPRAGGPAGSIVILFAPGAPREAYFEELAAIRAEGRHLSPDEWTELYARHDQYMV